MVYVIQLREMYGCSLLVCDSALLYAGSESSGRGGLVALCDRVRAPAATAYMQVLAGTAKTTVPPEPVVFLTDGDRGVSSLEWGATWAGHLPLCWFPGLDWA